MVVARLPKSLVALRKTGARPSRPNDAAGAAQLAREYLRIAQDTSDDSFVRYAEEALRPWREQTSAEILFLQAVVSQHQHSFGTSLAQLDRLLARQPDNSQALLLKASILTTLGSYAEVKAIFAAHLRLSATLTGMTLLLNAASLNGALNTCEETLARSIPESASREEKAFAWCTLAEMAVRRGNTRLAEERFRRSLDFRPGNSYTLAAYSDLLLRTGRREEILRLIEPQTRSEALLTRRALASECDDTDLIRQLTASGHLREAAMLHLQAHRPELALDNALSNWENQKEPIDTRLVLEAALGAKDYDAARAVLTWARTVRLEDQLLDKLSDRLLTELEKSHLP